MIELRTGLPRNGKTLSQVVELAALQKSWDVGTKGGKGSGGRPVFTNIAGLALPHLPIPIASEALSREGMKSFVPDWDAMPDGSLVIIDEAQEWFPPRSTQMQAPAHVAWLSVHGHRGFDICFITQHPKLVDFSLRALVGKHKHYRRVFGFDKAAVYEWDACSDNLGGMKNATVSYFPFPKSGFGLYKSASEHTKQKFKLPLWLGIPVIGLLLCLYFVPHAYHILVHGPEKAKPVPVAGAAAPSGILVTATPVGSGPPTSSSPGSLLAAAVTPPGGKHYLGCISKAGRCACLLDTGELKDAPDQCEVSAAGYTGKMALLASAGVSLPVSQQSTVHSDAPAQIAVMPAQGFGVNGGKSGSVRQPGQ
jgi:zona occludens toxin